MTPEAAIAVRRQQRAWLIDVARRWVADSREAGASITQAWVFGSVARGDHHAGSDIDVLVIATGMADHPTGCAPSPRCPDGSRQSYGLPRSSRSPGVAATRSPSRWRR